MTYRGERVRWRAPLGIKPTREDHDLVRSLSLLGVGVRAICVKMGERFTLEKPMSRQALYYHFRPDLVPRARGKKPSQVTVKKRADADVKGEIERMIIQASQRGPKKD